MSSFEQMFTQFRRDLVRLNYVLYVTLTLSTISVILAVYFATQSPLDNEPSKSLQDAVNSAVTNAVSNGATRDDSSLADVVWALLGGTILICLVMAYVVSRARVASAEVQVETRTREVERPGSEKRDEGDQAKARQDLVRELNAPNSEAASERIERDRNQREDPSEQPSETYPPIPPSLPSFFTDKERFWELEYFEDNPQEALELLKSRTTGTSKAMQDLGVALEVKVGKTDKEIAFARHHALKKWFSKHYHNQDARDIQETVRKVMRGLALKLQKNSPKKKRQRQLRKQLGKQYVWMKE